jgi:hypothetical protein
MQMGNRPKCSFTCWGLLGAWLLVLSACAPMQSPGPAGPKKLNAMQQKPGPEVESYRFEFEFDDSGGDAAGLFGSGYIVVSKAGKELQALPHGFEIPRKDMDATNWLDFRDFNGDGYLDFVVTRLYTQDGKQPLHSLYQFEPRNGRYFQVDAVSNAGEIRASEPGCLELRTFSASGLPRQEQHCFASQTARWQPKPPEQAKAQPPTTCDRLTPDLVVCRKARIEQDRQLLALAREHRDDTRQALERAKGKKYARNYAQSATLDHQSWQRYRNARCAAQVLEQALPVNTLLAATEQCRLEWTRDQLRRYKDQLARYATTKDKL